MISCCLSPITGSRRSEAESEGMFSFVKYLQPGTHRHHTDSNQNTTQN